MGLGTQYTEDWSEKYKAFHTLFSNTTTIMTFPWVQVPNLPKPTAEVGIH